MLRHLLLQTAQNARRPIFVSLFNDVMDKPQRATTLSIESQVRGGAVALLAPATGYIADSFGLPWAFLAISFLLAAANLIRRG